MKSLKLLILILFFATAELKAQRDYNEILPSSPTAASLGQYGNVPVSFYTGTPNISIPITVINGTELSLPLSLSYMAKGIKVEENASWVGTGWSLNCTGVITQTVQGQEDLSMPRLTFPLPTSVEPMKDVLLNIQEDFIDPEPDLYFFNFPGYSGSFVLDENGQAVIEEAKPIRIKRDAPPSFKFTITTENGTQYIFDRAEQTSTLSSGTSNGNSAMYLSKIISPTGKETIEFFYETEVTIFYSATRPTKRIRPTNIQVDAYNATWSRHVITGLRLDSIATNFGQHIGFLPDDQPRTDLSIVASPETAPRALKEIKFYDHSSAVKRRFAFDYETIETSLPYSPGPQTGPHPPADQYTAYANFRLYLKGVKELSSDGNEEKPPHLFTYKGRNQQNKDLLPNKLSASQDHWGYFNGSGNNNLWPGYSGPFGRFDWGFNLDVICTIPVDNVSRESFTVSGANRNANYPNCEYGTLHTITYPTGGKTVFEFEGHRYFFETVNGGYIKQMGQGGIQAYVPGEGPQLLDSLSTNAKLGSMFIFEFEVDCWNPNTHEIVPCYTNGERTVGAQVNFEKYQECSVRLLNSEGVEVIAAQWKPGDGGFWIYKGGLVNNDIGRLYPDENGFITRQIENLGLYTGRYSLIATRDPDSDNDVRGWFYYPEEVTVPINNPSLAKLAGGLRIKKIENFDENDKSVGKKTYAYGIGVMMDGPQYASYTYQGGSFFQPCDPSQSLDPSPFLEVSCGSQSALGYTQGSSIGYQSVVENHNGNGSIEYEYTTAIDYPDNPDSESSFVSYLHWSVSSPSETVLKEIEFSGKPAWPYLSRDNLDRKRGFLKKVTYKDNQGHTILIQENTPRFVDLNSVKGLRFRTLRPDIDWLYSTYQLSSGYVNIEHAYETQFDVINNTNFSKITTYSYESSHHNLLTKRELLDSDSSTYVTEFRYPDDYTNITDPTHVITQMKAENLHMIGSPIETRNYKNGKITGGSASVNKKYNKQGGGFFIAPLSAYKIKERIANPVSKWSVDPTLPDTSHFTKVVDLNFDTNANLIGVTQKDQVNISYLWEPDSPYPLAKAVNANNSRIYFNSFETNGIAENSSNPAKTGNHYRNSGTYNFSVDGGFSPSDPASLKMSYWYWSVDHWIFSNVVNFSNTISSTGTRLDDVRVYPKGSFLTTYTYDGLFGITSQTDPNNLTTYYQYDKLGRLLLIKDDKGNIIKKYTYHYAGE